MGRRLRPYVPGAAFHITTRTCGHEPWFEPLRDEIVAIIRHSLPRSDADLLAFCIMSNHLHLVIRQRAAPLVQLMHPICRRTARAVHRRWNREGRVFERPYRDTICLTPDHLRAAIVYTHLNPCVAGLCDDPAGYRWSSHALYAGTHTASSTARDPLRIIESPTMSEHHREGTSPGSPADEPSATPATAGKLILPKVTTCLQLFAHRPADHEELHDAYLRFVAWRRAGDPVGGNGTQRTPPPTLHGDSCWTRSFGSPPAAAESRPTRPSADLRDLARLTLREIDPTLDIDDLRNRKRGRIAEFRNLVIARALNAGHRGSQIARFFGVSDSTVSSVAATLVPRPPVRFEN